MPDNLQELLTRLKKLSPMPDDETVTDHQLAEYAAIIAELERMLDQNKDPRAIRPLIDSFGCGVGSGVYETTLRLLEKFEPEQLFPHLTKAVQQGGPGSRSWSAIILGHTQDIKAIPYLLPLLDDPEELVRADAVLALGAIGDPSTRQAVQRLQDDPSEEVSAAIEVALSDFPEED